ncbi:hypothetical protein [Umezawaea sp. NPDC059074]|uniref:hypothetical protein n=1 Tax=Umezawaea sp. NPDC059074 TaxID=3346716 RepID=UPI0036C9CB90
MTLTFGIYAGGRIALDDGSPPEDPARLAKALDDLHGPHPFLVRAYVHYPTLHEAPPNPEALLNGHRRLDLVACFRDPGHDLTGWLAFLRGLLHRHGSTLATLQITEEPDNAGPGGDGEFPAVRQALVEGVIAAKREARALGLDVRVGCNSTAIFDPAQEFWTDLGRRGGREFRESLDYAGLDFFPDVFRPIPADRFPDAVRAVLTTFRHHSLKAAGIPEDTPVHVTEHGWSTGPDRPDSRQAEVLDAVVREIAASDLNITTYEHFSLRDADSGQPDLLHNLGLLHDDHTPKPAFATYRDLIAEFTSPGTPARPA